MPDFLPVFITTLFYCIFIKYFFHTMYAEDKIIRLNIFSLHFFDDTYINKKKRDGPC